MGPLVGEREKGIAFLADLGLAIKGSFVWVRGVGIILERGVQRDGLWGGGG